MGTTFCFPHLNVSTKFYIALVKLKDRYTGKKFLIMNELNLQNPEFRKLLLEIFRSYNEIVVTLSPEAFHGRIGPLPTLKTVDPTLSRIQRWGLFLPVDYFIHSTKGDALYFPDVRTFDEINAKIVA